jgi:predicted site-specific integrase-resolvase
MAYPLLTQQHLSKLIEVSKRTLERWRVEGSGPYFVKAGRKCLYRPDDVDAWLDANRRKSTSEG